MTVVANVSKGQTEMSYKGELQTLTKLSIRHQVCRGETCSTTISERERERSVGCWDKAEFLSLTLLIDFTFYI